MSAEIQSFTGTALQVKNDFVDPIKNAITGALPLFMREDSEAWIRSAILEVSKTPQLVQYAKTDFPNFAGTLTRAALALDVEREKTARMEAENRALELKIKLMELEQTKKEEA